MQPAHNLNPYFAEFGRHGGKKRMEQLSTQERSALAKYAAWARWHPLEAQAAKEKAQQTKYLIQQALNNVNQLPLV